MLELMEQRRSCRNFTAQSVEPEKQALLLRAAQLAPSGRNIRPLEFVVIEEKETLAQLGNCRNPNQPFLPGAALAVAVLGDREKSDTWVEDGSIAMAFMQLEAERLGLGSCWVQIRLRESNQGMSSEAFVRTLLGIPEQMGVLAILAVGYPEKRLPPHAPEETETDRVYRERF